MKRVKKAAGWLFMDPMRTGSGIILVAMIIAIAIIDLAVAALLLGIFVGVFVASEVMVIVSDRLAKIGRKMWEDNK